MSPAGVISRVPGSGWSWRHTLIVLSVLLVFGRAASHEFTWWDDRMTIGANPRFNPPTLESLGFYWTHAEHGLYMPVTQTAWWLLAYPARLDAPDERGITLNPWLYHGLNVGIHALNALLAYSLLRRLLRDARAALLAALLFALHPVQVEPVAWASGTKDLLAWCFALAALRVHLLGHERPGAGKLVAWRCAAFLLAVLAMLSKPTALVLPLLAIVIDRVALRRSWRACLVPVVPWLLASSAIALITARAQPAPQVPSVPLHLRPLIALDALAFYLKQTVWPIDLTIDHGRRPAWVLSQWWGYATWLAPATIGLVLYLLRRWAPLVLLSGALFVIPLLPLLGLKRFLFQYYSTVAEHYQYMSMLGVGLLAGWSVSRHAGGSRAELREAGARAEPRDDRSGRETSVTCPRPKRQDTGLQSEPCDDRSGRETSVTCSRPKRQDTGLQSEPCDDRSGRETSATCSRCRGIVVVGWSLVVTLLAARSFVHAGVWRDDFALFSHALRVNPRSFLSHNNLGHAYLLQLDPASAELNFRKAVEIEPDFPVYRRNLAEALVALGRVEEGLEQLDESLRLSERYAWAGREQIAGAYVQAVDTAEAARRRDRSLAYLDRAMEILPGFELAKRKRQELESTTTAPSP